MLELSILAGILVAGGLFSLIFDDGSPESNASAVDEILDEDGEVVPANYDPVVPREDAEYHQLEMAIFSIDSAEWISGEVHSITASHLNTIPDVSKAIYLSDSDEPEFIDLSLRENVISYSGQGDTVLGGDTDGPEDIFVSVSSGGAKILGGDGDSVFLSNGDEDWVSAGAGDDFLLSGNHSSALDGGDGNDTIFGSYTNYFESRSNTTFDDLTDDSVDLISGGDGDDLIYASSEDIISTGKGSDLVNVFGAGAILSDFDPALDVLTITIEDEMFFGEGEVLELSRFKTVLNKDQISVLLDGTHLVTLNNSENLDVGVSLNFGESAQIISVLSGIETSIAPVLIVPYSHTLV